jgi:urocanate hydratase
MSWGELNQWEYKVYSQVKYYGNVTSLLWDSILQGIVRCMFMAMVAIWKVQEDDANRGKLVWSFSRLKGLGYWLKPTGGNQSGATKVNK